MKLTARWKEHRLEKGKNRLKNTFELQASRFISLRKILFFLPKQLIEAVLSPRTITL